MKRRPNRAQLSFYLPIMGGVPMGAVAAERWEEILHVAIERAIERNGKAMVAVLAGADQRSVENWLARRNLPSLAATVRLAAALPDFAQALADAIRAEAARDAA